MRKTVHGMVSMENAAEIFELCLSRRIKAHPGDGVGGGVNVEKLVESKHMRAMHIVS